MDRQVSKVSPPCVAGYPYKCDVFAKIGVKSWINAENWSTSIGGSCLEPRVTEAMREAAQSFIDMNELMEKASTRVAELCKVEAAYITTGAAAGIVLSIAACITGTDTVRMAQLYGGLESREALPNEVIMQAPHSSMYDCQYYIGGGKLVRVGYPYAVERQMVEDAISEKTICISYVHSYHSSPKELAFSEVVGIAREHDIPVVVDMAAIIPPKRNLHRFIDEGADLVVISGGKGIRGPQNTGLILGGSRHGRHLIEAIRMQSFPRYGIGRAFKVSKETIAGFLTALEIFVEQDEDETYARQLGVAHRIAVALEGIASLRVRIIPNDGQDFEHPVSPHVPRVCIEWDSFTVGFDAAGLDDIMACGTSPIRLRKPALTQANTTSSRNMRLVDPYNLREGEDEIVADRLVRAFAGA